MTPTFGRSPANRRSTGEVIRTERALRLPLLLVLGALSAFGPLSMDLYLPALPALADDLRTTGSMAQVTMTTCMIGLAVGQFVVGPISDGYGRRTPLLIGVAVYAAAALLCAFSPNIVTLVVLRAIQGLAGGAGIVIARAIVKDLCDSDEAARVYSLLVLVTGVAPVIAPILGAGLLYVGSWRATFVALSLIGCVLLAVTALVVPETLPREQRTTGGLRAASGQVTTALRDTRLLTAGVVLALSAIFLFSYLSMSSFVLQRQLGLSPQQFSLVFAGNAAGLMLAGWASSRLARRRGAHATLGVGLVVAVGGSAGLLAVAITGGGLLLVLPLLLPTVSSVALLLPNALAVGLTNQVGRGGTAAGLLGLAQFGVGGTVPPLVSGEGTSLLAMSSTMGVAAVSALIVWLVLLRPMRPSGPR